MKKTIMIFLLLSNFALSQFKIEELKLNEVKIVENYQNVMYQNEVLYFKGKYETNLILKPSDSEKVFSFKGNSISKNEMHGIIYEYKNGYFYFDTDIFNLIHVSNSPFKIYLYDKKWLLKKIILVYKKRIRGFYNVEFINDKYYMIHFYNCFSKNIFKIDLSKTENFNRIIKHKKYRTSISLNSDFDVRNSTMNFD